MLSKDWGQLITPSSQTKFALAVVVSLVGVCAYKSLPYLTALIGFFPAWFIAGVFMFFFTVDD